MQTTALDSASSLRPQRQAHVDGRLASNLMAWLTTVDESGQPHSVPVRFLRRAAGTLLTYTRRSKLKLKAIEGVALFAVPIVITPERVIA